MARINNKEDLVLDFIKQFRDLGAKNCFANGMCYWFAGILGERFSDENPSIMYDEIENHFGCKINDRIYDITGDVTEAYDWNDWWSVAMRDRLLTDRIMHDCRDKIPADVLVGGYCPHGWYDDYGVLVCDKDNHACGWNELCVFDAE